MTLRLDLIWLDDAQMEYRASCARCSYRSAPYDDEDTARAAWFGHVCVRSGSTASA